MTEMWDEATEPLQAEAERRRFHYALADADAHWPFLAAAQSEGEYIQRKAMVGNGWESGIHEEFDRRFAAQRLASSLEMTASPNGYSMPESGKYDSVAAAVKHVNDTNGKGANYADVAYLMQIDLAAAKRRVDSAVESGQIERRGDSGKVLFAKTSGSFRDMMDAENKVTDHGTCKHCGKAIVQKGGSGGLWYEEGAEAAGDICIKNKGTVRQYGGFHEPSKKKTSSAEANVFQRVRDAITSEEPIGPKPYGHEHATDDLRDALDDAALDNPTHHLHRRERPPKIASPSDVCPECGAHMEDVQVKDDILRAKCDNCGWTGMKRQSAKIAAEEDPNAYEQGYHDGYFDGTRGGRGGFGLQNNPRSNDEEYASGYYNGFDAAVYSEDNMLPVIGAASDGYRVCPTCKGGGSHPWDAAKKCPRCKGTGMLRPPKGKRDPDLESIFSALHEATDQDLLDAESALDSAGGDLDKAASFFGDDLLHRRERHSEEDGARYPGLTPEQTHRVTDRGDVLRQRHRQERDEARASDERHEEYYRSHPSEHRQMASREAAGRDLLARDPEDHLHSDLEDDLLAGQEHAPLGTEREGETRERYRGPTPLDYLMHGLFPSGASAAKTAAVGDNIYGDEIKPDLAPEVKVPTTTRPRVTPELPRQTEFSIPGSPEGLDPTTPYTDPGTTAPVDRRNFSQPTFEQAVAAKVAKIAKQVGEDNPHLSTEASRRLAMQALSSYPEMVRH